MGKKGLEPPRGYDEIGFQGGSSLPRTSGRPQASSFTVKSSSSDDPKRCGFTAWLLHEMRRRSKKYHQRKFARNHPCTHMHDETESKVSVGYEVSQPVPVGSISNIDCIDLVYWSWC